MNRVCFDLHWVLFCCWLYLHGVFLGEYWQFYWHLLAGKLTEIWGGEKNKQSHEQNPDPSLLPNHHTGQVQTKVWVTAQEKLWPGEESRCECCQLSPSLTNTVDSNCSHLPFMRFLACTYCAGFVHLNFHARSDNPKSISPAVPALRSSCSQGGQRLVRTAPNNDHHHLSHPGCRHTSPVPSAESLKLPKCPIIRDSTDTECTGPEEDPDEDKIIRLWFSTGGHSLL